MLVVIIIISLLLAWLSAYAFAFQKTAENVSRLLGRDTGGESPDVFLTPRIQKIRLAASLCLALLLFGLAALVYHWYVGILSVAGAVVLGAGGGSISKWRPGSRKMLASVIPHLSDESWLALMVKNIAARGANRLPLADLPGADLQRTFVGGADEETLKEAFSFYRLVKERARNAGVPLSRNTRLLDFGCGWGRLIRFFWKDIAEDNLFGCDVNEEILAVCRATRVPGNFVLIEPDGKLPYPDAYFDAMVAYSVFTHLPERMNLHWMRELARVSRPGCIFCLTLEPRRFIDFITNIPPETESDWHLKLSRFAGLADELYRKFDSGEVAFIASDGEALREVYGDAVVPPSFIERTWAPYFEIVDYIDDPGKFWQAALVLQRRRVAGGQDLPRN